MTIQLSPTVEKRLAREAKARGIKPKDIVEEALNVYWQPSKSEPLFQSEDWNKLRELTRKYKKRHVDFDTAVSEAKAKAYQLYEDNIEIIELAAKRYTRSGKSDIE